VTDREALLAELNNGRRLTLLALADVAEEADERYLSAGLRWLAKFDRWPVFVARRDDVYDEEGDYVTVDKGGAGDQSSPSSSSAGWEWWRAKPAAIFSCSLPAVLIDTVRKEARALRGKTCVFDSPAQAILAAAAAAGKLIAAELLEGA
jgi:hypothetical protein